MACFRCEDAGRQDLGPASSDPWRAGTGSQQCRQTEGGDGLPNDVVEFLSQSARCVLVVHGNGPYVTDRRPPVRRSVKPCLRPATGRSGGFAAGVVTTISDGDDLRARDGGCTTARWTGAGSGSATAGSRGGATAIGSSSEA